MLPHPKLNWLAAILLAASLATPAMAGTLFKWTTEDGSVAFTDDPERIPERYRSQVKKIETRGLDSYERFTPRDSAGQSEQQKRLQERLERLRAMNRAAPGVAIPAPGVKPQLIIKTDERTALTIPADAAGGSPGDRGGDAGQRPGLDLHAARDRGASGRPGAVGGQAGQSRPVGQSSERARFRIVALSAIRSALEIPKHGVRYPRASCLLHEVGQLSFRLRQLALRFLQLCEPRPARVTAAIAPPRVAKRSLCDLDLRACFLHALLRLEEGDAPLLHLRRVDSATRCG